GEGMAAEKALVVAFLVRPSGNVDAEPGAARICGKGAGQLEPVDHAERAVEPAAIGLGLTVRSHQQPPPRPRIAADYIADAVDQWVEPGFPQLLGEPMPRLDINGRIGRPMDTGLVAPEFGEPLEIGDDPLSVDIRHLQAPGARLPQCC